jgi:hypothetical protein
MDIFTAIAAPLFTGNCHGFIFLKNYHDIGTCQAKISFDLSKKVVQPKKFFAQKTHFSGTKQFFGKNFFWYTFYQE